MSVRSLGTYIKTPPVCRQSPENTRKSIFFRDVSEVIRHLHENLSFCCQSPENAWIQFLLWMSVRSLGTYMKTLPFCWQSPENALKSKFFRDVSEVIRHLHENPSFLPAIPWKTRFQPHRKIRTP